MITSLKYLLLLLPLAISQARQCSVAQAADADTYIKWVENPDNGIFVTKQLNDFVFSLQYKPLPYVVMQDEKRMLTQKEMQEKTTAFSDMQYYTFRIGTTAGSDVQRYKIDNEQQFYARLEYFSLNMQQDLQLIDNGDTLSCLLFHFERTYGIDPRSTFVLAFPKSKNLASTKTFIYNDRVLGTGPILLSITSNDLQQIPELSLPE
jgi:hypothetical protein